MSQLFVVLICSTKFLVLFLLALSIIACGSSSSSSDESPSSSEVTPDTSPLTYQSVVLRPPVTANIDELAWLPPTESYGSITQPDFKMVIQEMLESPGVYEFLADQSQEQEESGISSLSRMSVIYPQSSQDLEAWDIAITRGCIDLKDNRYKILSLETAEQRVQAYYRLVEKGADNATYHPFMVKYNKELEQIYYLAFDRSKHRFIDDETNALLENFPVKKREKARQILKKMDKKPHIHANVCRDNGTVNTNVPYKTIVDFHFSLSVEHERKTKPKLCGKFYYYQSKKSKATSPHTYLRVSSLVSIPVKPLADEFDGCLQDVGSNPIGGTGYAVLYGMLKEAGDSVGIWYDANIVRDIWTTPSVNVIGYIFVGGVAIGIITKNPLLSVVVIITAMTTQASAVGIDIVTSGNLTSNDLSAIERSLIDENVVNTGDTFNFNIMTPTYMCVIPNDDKEQIDTIRPQPIDTDDTSNLIIDNDESITLTVHGNVSTDEYVSIQLGVEAGDRDVFIERYSIELPNGTVLNNIPDEPLIHLTGKHLYHVNQELNTLINVTAMFTNGEIHQRVFNLADATDPVVPEVSITQFVISPAIAAPGENVTYSIDIYVDAPSVITVRNINDGSYLGTHPISPGHSHVEYTFTASYIAGTYTLEAYESAFSEIQISQTVDYSVIEPDVPNSVPVITEDLLFVKYPIASIMSVCHDLDPHDNLVLQLVDSNGNYRSRIDYGDYEVEVIDQCTIKYTPENDTYDGGSFRIWVSDSKDSVFGRVHYAKSSPSLHQADMEFSEERIDYNNSNHQMRGYKAHLKDIIPSDSNKTIAAEVYIQDELYGIGRQTIEEDTVEQFMLNGISAFVHLTAISERNTYFLLRGWLGIEDNDCAVSTLSQTVDEGEIAQVDFFWNTLSRDITYAQILPLDSDDEYLDDASQTDVITINDAGIEVQGVRLSIDTTGFQDSSEKIWVRLISADDNSCYQRLEINVSL